MSDQPVLVAPPVWKRDFPYEAAAEEEVTRREFARYLVLGTGAMAVGNVGLAVWTQLRSINQGSPRAIVAAVRARLVGVESKTAVVTVRCLTSTGSTYTCGTEGTLRDRAQVKVDVTWSWSPVSFVGHGMPIDEITGSAGRAT